MKTSTDNALTEFKKDFRIKDDEAKQLLDSLYHARQKEIEYEDGQIGKLETFSYLYRTNFAQTPTLLYM